MWEIMSGVIGQVLSLIPAEKRARTEAHEKMRIAVMNAFHKTEAYYSRRKAGAENNQNDEYEIAQLWETTSVLVEKYDKKLAKRLGMKALFWRDENIWSNLEIQNAGIGLEQIKEETMKLKK